MRIFLTGATGFIGSQIIPELLGVGHQVIGLTRSDAGAATLSAAGVEPFRGTLEEPAGLIAGAAQADAVIHTAFDHDFANFVANCAKDERVIKALGGALVGTDKPFLITSGTGIGSKQPGQVATEDVANLDSPIPPRRVRACGGRTVGGGHQGRGGSASPGATIRASRAWSRPTSISAARKGVAAYVGEGANRWPAAHVSDVARLYRLAVEQGKAGERFHASAEEGVMTRDIAAAVGAGLGVPVVSLSSEQAMDHFGWLGMFAAHDMPASSAWTRERLGWRPEGPGLIADLQRMDYAAALPA